jgi:hypothetical protein
MKSGNLNFLEPSGPLEACNGTALPSITMQQGNMNVKCINVYYKTSRIYSTRVLLIIKEVQTSVVIRYVGLWNRYKFYKYDFNGDFFISLHKPHERNRTIIPSVISTTDEREWSDSKWRHLTLQENLMNYSIGYRLDCDTRLDLADLPGNERRLFMQSLNRQFPT